jgi:hypothetical protein
MQDLAGNAERVYAQNYPADVKSVQVAKRHWWKIF